jgi:PAS domain S-box-containing protein
MGALLEALSDLHYIHDRTHLFTFALNRACDVLKAQGGTFYTLKEDIGELYPEASKGVSLSLLREIPFKINVGVAGWTVANRKAVVVDNAQTDARFNRAVDVITGIRTRSLLCIPVIRQDKFLGVLELVNRVDGVFRDPDLEFLQHFCQQLGVALENCRLYEQTDHLLAYTTSVINSLTGGFLSIDTKGITTRCNMAACRILSIVETDVVDKPLLKALPTYPALAAILDVTQRNQTAVARQDIELQKPDGSTMVIGYSTFLIRNDNGLNLGAGLIFQDITHLKR